MGTKRKTIGRPVNNSASPTVAPSSGYLPWWNRSFVFLHDRLRTRRCAKKRTTERTTSCEEEERGGAGEKRKTVWERKEGPVIGICAVEKPWKINYRPCKGAENYIDRRRARKVFGTLRFPSSSLPNTVIGSKQRLILWLRSQMWLIARKNSWISDTQLREQTILEREKVYLQQKKIRSRQLFFPI